MLYVIHRADNEGLQYRDGQGPIVHLEADLHEAVEWAERHGRRWAFTLSNAGSRYFQDRCDLAQLGELNWAAIQARDWRACKEGKQAEFLMEQSLSWTLIRRVGVCTAETHNRVTEAVRSADHQPAVTVQPGWYYR